MTDQYFKNELVSAILAYPPETMTEAERIADDLLRAIRTTDSVTPGGDERTAAMQDLSYANGFRAGWNAGAACQNGGDEAANKRLESVMRRHSEALQFLKGARNLGPAQPEAGAGLRERIVELIKEAMTPELRLEKAYQAWKGEHHEYAKNWSETKLDWRAKELADAILALGAPKHSNGGGE